MDKFLEILKFILLGLIQGITEPLPISSSGHMLILDSLFKNFIPAEAMNNFQILMNTASLVAIIFYYKDFLREILSGSYRYLFQKRQEEAHRFRYLLLILLASVPAAIIGAAIKILDLDRHFTNIVCVAICLFITALLLFYVHRQNQLTREEIKPNDAVLMGFGQAIGLLPGISRSGITASFGIANGITTEAAFRFSFMMYIPASIGAAVLGFFELTRETNINYFGYAAGFVASFLGTYFAVRFFFKLLRKKNLIYFAFYCMAISLLLFLMMIAGII